MAFQAKTEENRSVPLSLTHLPPNGVSSFLARSVGLLISHDDVCQHLENLCHPCAKWAKDVLRAQDRATGSNVTAWEQLTARVLDPTA